MASRHIAPSCAQSNVAALFPNPTGSPFIAALLAPVGSVEGPSLTAERVEKEWTAARKAFQRAESDVEKMRAMVRLGLVRTMSDGVFAALTRAADRLIRAPIPRCARTRHTDHISAKTRARRQCAWRAKRANGDDFACDWDEIIAADKAATPAPRAKGVRHD